MIPVYQHAMHRVAVLGLGKSGIASLRALSAAGAIVSAWDDNAQARDAVAADPLPGVDLVDLNDPALWSGDTAPFDLILWSPGIPHTHPQPHPVATHARSAGIPLVCDVELLMQSQPTVSSLCITGTNGKSTTTALIGHIFATAGLTHAVGGNIGTPALALDPLDFTGTYVLELSSYQLELMPSLNADIAILLNISPDHLDRHGGMGGYVDAKLRIFNGSKERKTAILGIDDPPCRGIRAELSHRQDLRIIPISAKGLAPGGVFVQNAMLYSAMDGSQPEALLDLSLCPALPGSHNHQNAAAAYAACRVFGIDRASILHALQSFPGLPHRQELVATLGPVRFINDSKATNADATDKALGCYDSIYWILGGRAKESGLDGLEDHYGRIRHAYTIGEAGDAFADRLANAGVTVSRMGTLDAATRAAWAQSQSDKSQADRGDTAQSDGDGDGETESVILLSPACASWDQFKSFEARGDAFRSLAQTLVAEGGP